MITYILYRYLFAFQWPVIPEVYMRQFDLGGVEASLTAEGSGAREGTFSEEDIEAFKYYFRGYCKSISLYPQ